MMELENFDFWTDKWRNIMKFSSFSKFNFKSRMKTQNSSHLLSTMRDGITAHLSSFSEKECMHVGQNTTVGDSRLCDDLIQLLIVTNRELNVARSNSFLLGLSAGIPG